MMFSFVCIHSQYGLCTSRKEEARQAAKRKLEIEGVRDTTEYHQEFLNDMNNGHDN
jgi:hypothetical protein